jgi:hypothetical protein
METETEEVSQLTKADNLALKGMPPEDQKLITRIRAAFKAYSDKMAKWEDDPTKPRPVLPQVVKFYPFLKKLDGGVTVNLWPGSSRFNQASGEQEVKGSTHLDIRLGGYAPASLDEALRLLVLARMPNHVCGIVTEDRREVAADLKTAEQQNAALREELTAKDDALEAAKAELAALKAGKK